MHKTIIFNFCSVRSKTWVWNKRRNRSQTCSSIPMNAYSGLLPINQFALPFSVPNNFWLKQKFNATRRESKLISQIFALRKMLVGLHLIFMLNKHSLLHVPSKYKVKFQCKNPKNDRIVWIWWRRKAWIKALAFYLFLLFGIKCRLIFRIDQQALWSRHLIVTRFRQKKRKKREKENLKDSEVNGVTMRLRVDNNDALTTITSIEYEWKFERRKTKIERKKN